MKAKPRQCGLTLMEMTVVIVVVALLVSFSMPTIRTFFSSMALSGGTKSIISASLASARAIAAKEQRYAGIRFQKRLQEDNKGPQYMIFIVHDQPNTKLSNGFRVVEGIQPIKLPEAVGVMEFVSSDAEIDDSKITDKTTFSIVFSPSGKLVIHGVRVRNKDGRTDNASEDDIFNTLDNVGIGIGMFVQDHGRTSSDEPREEQSKNGFIIYDKTQFDKIKPDSRRSDYLDSLDVIHINPYTGTIISSD